MSKARVHTAYGAIWKLLLGTRRKWPRVSRDRDETETLTIFLETRRWYVSRPRRRDRDHNPAYNTRVYWHHAI